MTHSFERRGDTTIVFVGAQLTIDDQDELTRIVGDELERGSRKFILDFNRTSRIDNAGISTLLSVLQRVRAAASELRATHLNADLRRFFELTRLDSYFTRVDDDDDGGATRVATLPTRPSGPVAGAAEDDFPDREPGN